MKTPRDVAAEVGNTISTLQCLEVHRATHGKTHIGFECSCRSEAVWAPLLKNFLLHARGFRTHICQRYVARSGQVVPYWHLQFQADDLSEAAPKIIEQLLKARLDVEKVVSGTRAVRDVPPVVSEPSDNPSGGKQEPFRPKTRRYRAGGAVYQETEAPVPWKTNPEKRGKRSRGAAPIRA